MSKRVVIAAVALCLAGAGAVAWWWRAAVDRDAKAIRGSGIIEVTQVDAAFEVPGRIAERFVDEGAVLDKGEPIARLDDREYRLQVDRARGIRGAAEARYRLLLSGARARDVDQALAALDAAESDLTLQQREHERLANLFRQGIVSQSELDRVRTGMDQAHAARDRAAAALDLLREGFRTEEIEEARSRVQEAKAALEIAELDLARCELFAPVAGRVLSKSREPGEMVEPGTPVVTIGDLSRPWVNVYVGERDLGKVRLGMRGWVTIDSFPDQPFPGTVTFVADRAEFTPKNIQTPDERVKLVYRVKLEVETRDTVLKPGMPADAVLPLNGPDTHAATP